MQRRFQWLHGTAMRALGGSLLLLSACHAAGDASDTPTAQQNLDLIGGVMSQVEKSYVHPVDGQQLTTNALKGMLSRLDPHSDYMDAQELHEFEGDTRGRFGGLGMELTEENGLPKVIAPIDDTPAAHAGIEPGDVITRIDGKPTDGMGLMKIVETLRGEPGTSVTITVSRVHKAPFDTAITRAIIDVATVKSALEPNAVGYARITEFGQNTQEEMQKAIASLTKKAGGHLNGFVLDLRNDPGGMLDAAVDVSGDFLDGGTVVSIRGRSGDDDHTYSAPAHGDSLPGTPVLVLINSASASASEIVAGALQDRHRATIMGTPSFGKGSVQTILPVEGGGALRLTTALYYTPSGRSIQDRGISPDIVAGVPADEQVADEIVQREADFSGAFANASAEAPPPRVVNPDEDRPIKPTLIGTPKDAQLAAALKALHGGAIHAAR
jgi:carboxyl-terminal processing protease